MILVNNESPKKPSPLKILLLAPPGHGKTIFGLQWPNVHVMDCDQNLDGPIRFLKEGVKDPSGRIVIPPKMKDLSITYDTIRFDEAGKALEIERCFDRLYDKLMLSITDPAYQARSTFFIDSLSHVNEFIIRKVIFMKGKKSMEINLWTDFASQAYTLLVGLLDRINKTILCSCHEERITEPDDENIMKKKVVEVNPLFSGRVGDSLGAFFTDVWQLEKKPGPGGKTELKLYANRTPKCSHLKNSVGLPDEIDITNGLAVLGPYLKGRI